MGKHDVPFKQKYPISLNIFFVHEKNKRDWQVYQRLSHHEWN